MIQLDDNEMSYSLIVYLFFFFACQVLFFCLTYFHVLSAWTIYKVILPVNQRTSEM